MISKMFKALLLLAVVSTSAMTSEVSQDSASSASEEFAEKYQIRTIHTNGFHTIFPYTPDPNSKCSVVVWNYKNMRHLYKHYARIANVRCKFVSCSDVPFRVRYAKEEISLLHPIYKKFAAWFRSHRSCHKPSW